MSKKLIIAEKPSVAREIAQALGGFTEKNGQGGRWLERDDLVVSSAIGHLVELACPETDDPGYVLEKLPALPARFNLAPIEKTKSQLVLLRQLIARPDVTTVVNACDAGREGELIFRYIALFCGCCKDMMRMWLQSMTPAAIRTAYAGMRPSKERDGLFAAAQSRSEADWLVGINGTRAVSILASRQAGERVKSSVGRVQTPTLNLIVTRETIIRDFVPKGYAEVHATFAVQSGEYAAKWIQVPFQEDPANPDGKAERLFDVAAAKAIVAKCSGRAPDSVSETATEQSVPAPRLFDLTSLQQEANKLFGLSAKETLALAQSLYEQHKVLTYPRTDSNCLPEDYLDTTRQTLQKLAQAQLPISRFSAEAVPWVKPDKRIFNNAKISDHFAIIPTGQTPGNLSQNEMRVFELVCKRFVAAFFPAAKYQQTVRLTVVAGETFKSSGRVIIAQGWRAVYGHTGESQDEPALCALLKDELPRILDIKTVSLKTKPPIRYTEATLLAAMESAGAGIEDEELRDAMKERGLGTPATRASIIEKLIDVEYIRREKKSLVPTDKGFALIQFLQENGLSNLGSAQTTGEWEMKLRQMEQGVFSRRVFMDEIATLTREIIARVQAKARALPEVNRGASGQRQPFGAACPQCGQPLTINERVVAHQGAACDFKLWREIAGRLLSPTEAELLITQGSHPSLTGFNKSKGGQFAAGLALLPGGKVQFVFPERAVRQEGAG